MWGGHLLRQAALPGMWGQLHSPESSGSKLMVSWPSGTSGVRATKY